MSPAKSGIWTRLAQATVLEEQTTTTAAGETVHTSLVNYPGKYSRILVRETSSVNPRTGQTALRQEAMVADHMLVRQLDGMARKDFEQGLQRAGMRVLAPLSSEGVYLVGFSATNPGSLDQAMGAVAGAVDVAYAEPDYMVFSAENVENRRLIINGSGTPGATIALPSPLVVSAPNSTQDDSGGSGQGNPPPDVSIQSTPTLVINPIALNVTLAQSSTGNQILSVGNTGLGLLDWNLVQEAVRPATGPAPHPAVSPNDTFYFLLYGLKDPGTTGAGIDATHAWSITTGSNQVYVAVIDTGVDPGHPDLAANIDTANGWNFVNNTNNPFDDNGHGTHVAGTIAARGNNSLGVAGVTWNCKVIALKFLDASGNGFTSDAVNAVNYATARNIPITNNSWGGGGFSQSLYDAILNSRALFVAAAGNFGINNDATPFYPSSFNCSNILAVAATDSTDTLASFSHYGATTVDLAAPGVDIASTYPGNQYAYMSGTSMATPHVSGAAALLMSATPTLRSGQLKQLLMASTDPKPSLAGKMVTGGRMNVYTALRMTYPAWLTPQATSGTVGSSQSQHVSLNFSTAGLAIGQYSQTLYVDSNDPLAQHVPFPVTLQVTSGPPQIQLTIVLTPSNGQWRIDGGAWQASGITVTGLAAGDHVVEYGSLSGYTSPATETVTLASGQSLALGRAYTVNPAQLTITLAPTHGQWRIDGGVWQASGATVTGLTPGNHQVDYQALLNYFSPATETVAIAAGQAVSLSRSYTATPYAVTSLDSLGGNFSFGVDINLAGAIAGYSNLPDNSYHAVRWINGTVQDLGVLGGGGTATLSQAFAINNSGDIVGTSSLINNTIWRAFRWSNGVMQSLGATSYEAYAINSGGTIVGHLRPGNGTTRAFRWNNGITEDLGTLGGNSSRASGITDAGVIVGRADVSGDVTHAFRWSNGVMQDLGTLGGAESGAAAINESGVIVGHSDIAGGATFHAIRYSNGAMQDLGTLPSMGTSYSFATAINESGDIVGTSTGGSSGQRAFIYRNGVMQDLNASISIPSVVLDDARGINDLGQIIANGTDSRPYLLTPINAPGGLQVDLSPSSGQWRVDGGSWQAGGTATLGLTAGVHTVEYNTLPGYTTAPPTETVTILNGRLVQLARSYSGAQPAQVTVTLTPATGQWRIDGGAWQASGATVAGLSAGNHSLEYISLSGYNAPAAETITLAAGQSLSLNRAYTVPPAQLTITLTPSSGQWRVDGGTWQSSGATVTGLAPGNHTVEYSSLSGYTAPATETVTLSSGQSLNLNRSYIAQQGGSVRINLTPSSGRWRVDAGAWVASGTTVTGLAAGSHAVEYDGLSGYAKPPAETVTLAGGQALILDRSYTQLALLSVTLTPTTGKWRVDGGGWRASGSSPATLAPGAHLVEYDGLTGYIKPPAESVTLTAGQNLSLARSYTPNAQAAQLTVTLSPATGQWRVDGGAWRASGTTATGLATGNHTVEYNTLSGYTSPPTETIALAASQSLSLSRSYTPTSQPAQLTVNLTPSNAQWRVDGGAWQASGATVSGLAAGNHTLEYNSLAGHTAPATETVNLSAGQSLALTRTYTALPAQLTVTLTPSSGQWRVDSGAWQASGATVAGLAAGTHTVEYNGLSGYTAPATETVNLAPGQSFSLNRSYTALPAQLTVTLTPSNGQWRVDGGAWQPSGTTVTGLVAGDHQVEYNSLAGYDAPTTETVTLTPGQSLSLNRSYTAIPAQLTVTLTPSNGQWRIDGGAWQASGATVTGIAAGDHQVSYAALANYFAPATETVTLAAGQSQALARSYLAATYAATNLGTLGGTRSYGEGINLAGSVAGYSYTTADSTIHAFRWSNGTMLDLGTLSGNYSAAYGINNAGDVAGASSAPGTPTVHAFRWSNGVMQDLGTLGGSTSEGHAINSAGTVVGYSHKSNGQSHAFRWSNGTITDLGTLGGTESAAFGINAAGVIVGRASIAGDNETYAFRNDNGVMQNLGSLGGQGSSGLAINDAGVIVGSSYLAGQSAIHAFRYSGGVMEDLGGQLTSYAYSINNAGVIVGISDTAPAMIYQGGSMQDLNALVSIPGVQLVEATGVNDLGQIVANGSDNRPYVLTLASGPGGLQVNFTPSIGQWRVDGGAWQAGGAAVLGLAPGNHVVDYNAVSGYVAPTTETVTIPNGRLLQLDRSYTGAPSAQVTVTLTPVTGQWRIDGGAWQASGATVGGLSAGNHTLEYNSLSGYTAPPTETITLAAGQSLSLSRSYTGTQPGSLRINLTPANGRWRVDAGAWRANGATVTGLAVGNHNVEYDGLAGYTKPAAETITLASGQALVLTRSYIQQAQLSVTLTPTTGKWRVDGGSWRASGPTTVTLAPGDHLIEYDNLSGYVKPPAETVTLTAGQNLALARSYTQ